MKILIENTVPLNNGDAALIFGVGEKFKNKGMEVEYSTLNLNIISEKYPSEKWVKSILTSKVTKLPLIGFIYLLIKLLSSTKYREFDAFVSAPGGYVNSYYGFKRKLQLLVLCKVLFKRKIYMYSQSIGPINKRDQKILNRYLKYFDLFYVRDNISKKRMDELGYYENVVQTKDAAFLLKPFPNKNEKFNKVAISVREWGYDGRSEKTYIELITKIVSYLNNLGYHITFLSTCQGEPTYRDDSVIANQIYNKLPEDVKKNVTVDSKYYTLNDLRNKLTEFDYTVGTRLHMCILSWLSGTPAFNISYEEKGKECYDYLAISEYSIDYNYTGNVNSLLSSFIELKNREQIFNRIKTVQNETEVHFEKIYENIINGKSQ
ncbi:polysaccharide pyruvyl transferase family protein [Niallia taxi]|uniref:polysaccharide pyruvyl transferase family protein n=1 Tax=Niallia taxi TaxID=2499688 RepID=UPI00317A832D